MKRVFVSALLVLSLLGVYTAGYVQAQKAASQRDAFMTQLAEGRAELVLRGLKIAAADKPEDYKDTGIPGLAFVGALSKGVDDPELAHAVIAQEAASYYENKTNTQSAPQASQVANETSVQLQLIQAAQNERIIELLKQIAANRK